MEFQLNPTVTAGKASSFCEVQRGEDAAVHMNSISTRKRKRAEDSAEG